MGLKQEISNICNAGTALCQTIGGSGAPTMASAFGFTPVAAVAPSLGVQGPVNRPGYTI